MAASGALTARGGVPPVLLSGTPGAPRPLAILRNWKQQMAEPRGVVPSGPARATPLAERLAPVLFGPDGALTSRSPTGYHPIRPAGLNDITAPTSAEQLRAQATVAQTFTPARMQELAALTPPQRAWAGALIDSAVRSLILDAGDGRGPLQPAEFDMLVAHVLRTAPHLRPAVSATGAPTRAAAGLPNNGPASRTPLGTGDTGIGTGVTAPGRARQPFGKEQAAVFSRLETMVQRLTQGVGPAPPRQQLLEAAQAAALVWRQFGNGARVPPSVAERYHTTLSLMDRWRSGNLPPQQPPAGPIEAAQRTANWAALRLGFVGDKLTGALTAPLNFAANMVTVTGSEIGHVIARTYQDTATPQQEQLVNITSNLTWRAIDVSQRVQGLLFNPVTTAMTQGFTAAAALNFGANVALGRYQLSAGPTREQPLDVQRMFNLPNDGNTIAITLDPKNPADNTLVFSYRLPEGFDPSFRPSAFSRFQSNSAGGPNPALISTVLFRGWEAAVGVNLGWKNFGVRGLGSLVVVGSNVNPPYPTTVGAKPGIAPGTPVRDRPPALPGVGTAGSLNLTQFNLSYGAVLGPIVAAQRTTWGVGPITSLLSARTGAEPRVSFGSYAIGSPAIQNNPVWTGFGAPPEPLRASPPQMPQLSEFAFNDALGPLRPDALARAKNLDAAQAFLQSQRDRWQQLVQDGDHQGAQVLQQVLERGERNLRDEMQRRQTP
jgi:hypothetical protein